MLRKLSLRFSAAAILSLFVIELILIAFINGLNYRDTLRQTDETLSFIITNGGSLPDKSDLAEFRKDAGKPPEPRELSGDKEQFGHFGRDERTDREMRYTIRYFSAVCDNEGNIKKLDTGHIATVASDTAEQFAREVFASADTKGFYSGMSFRYEVRTQEDGSRLAVFCDFSTAAQNFGRVAKLSAEISVGLLAVFAVIILLLSKRIVKPVIENQEKQARFITDAGHELKTPLAIIRANTEVIEMTSGETEWTKSTINQVDRLSELLGRMLMLAKSSESSRFSFAETDLSALARKLADNFTTYCNAEGKPLTADIAEDITLIGDARMLDMLISTLLENAVKYGKPDCGIEFSLRVSGRHIRLRVTNLCADPPKGDTSLLFDRFYRGDSSRTRETGGSGIGLSIAKMITEAHKGRISCTVEGERVTFTVRLPLKAKGSQPRQ